MTTMIMLPSLPDDCSEALFSPVCFQKGRGNGRNSFVRPNKPKGSDKILMAYIACQFARDLSLHGISPTPRAIF
jgi:hypothetical protein